MNSSARPKKTGTITLGLSLIAIGAAFMFIDFDSPNQLMILFSLWPLVLIALGSEVLISGKMHPEQTFSAASIILLIVLLGFAFFMAYMELMFCYYIPNGYFF